MKEQQTTDQQQLSFSYIGSWIEIGSHYIFHCLILIFQWEGYTNICIIPMLLVLLTEMTVRDCTAEVLAIRSPKQEELIGIIISPLCPNLFIDIMFRSPRVKKRILRFSVTRTATLG